MDPSKKIEEINKSEDPLRRVINRIVAGCCLHLAYFDQGPSSISLPPTNTGLAKKKKIDVRTLIQDDQKIFVLQGINTQGKSRLHGEESTGITLRPHWRRGYLHKPRNSPPGSPKTEWTRPTKVNAHLQLPGTLSVGSATILSDLKKIG